MAGPRAELRSLQRTVAELERHFLAPYLTTPTLGAPKREETLQVGAYVVLAHGALENYVEGVALWVLDKLVTNWTTAQRAGRCTASALLYQAVPSLDDSRTTVYDNIREALDEANRALSRVIRDNNGITPRHLKGLFYPLGVNVPSDPVLTGSLEAVISMRHYWAHQYRHGASVIKSAADARLAVGDCLKFADELAKEATSARP